MTRRFLERALWFGAVFATCGGLLVFRTTTVNALASTRISALPAVGASVARATADSLESAVGDIADRNLFRPERTSAQEREVSPPTGVAMTLGAVPKPRLILRGVLGGPPWDAIIEGIPGRDGSVVVRAGESVGGITVRSVGRDTVRVRGLDTTWTLTLARTW
jgi:hypothetical protein